MILPDVNVLVYAHREESPNHFAYLRWLEGLLSSSEDFGISDLVLSGFIRIVTHPRVFAILPVPLNQALTFVDESPKSGKLCEDSTRFTPLGYFLQAYARLAGAKGNLISDAYSGSPRNRIRLYLDYN